MYVYVYIYIYVCVYVYMCHRGVTIYVCTCTFMSSSTFADQLAMNSGCYGKGLM